MPGKNRKANKDKKIADKNEPLNGSKTRPRNGSQTKLNSNQALLTVRYFIKLLKLNVSLRNIG